MTISQIEQLTEWYESAERITKTNLPRSGDFVISPFFNGTGYHIELKLDDWAPDIVQEGWEDARILARAPKPKPAWHNAIAVLASTSDFGLRRVFVKDVDGVWNDALSGRGSLECDLLDVTPLIEARVSDDMVKRAVEGASVWTNAMPDSLARVMLTAALGLEDQ